jgi:hypothetical protein
MLKFFEKIPSVAYVAGFIGMNESLIMDGRRNNLMRFKNIFC